MAEGHLDNDHEGRTPDSGGGGWILLVIFGLLFLPALLIAAGVYWIMLRWLRQRPSVTATVSGLLIAVAILGWNITDAWENVQFVFSSFSNMTNHWQDLIVPALWINTVLGSIFGFILVMLSVRGMKRNPDRLQLKGGWEYKFEFRRTPVQLLRRARRVQGLKNGDFVAGGIAPLGIDEDTEDRVAYRYGEEAAKHTLMSGSSGSGKTITLLSMALSDIVNGEPIIVVDFKRSPELAGKLSSWANEYGADFYHFVNGDPSTYDVQHSNGQSFYDPLSTGSPTAQADMVLGMREYDAASEVYKSNMQQLLQVLFQMIHYAKEKRKLLSGRELERFAPKIEWNQGGIYLVYSAVESNEAFGQLVEVCEGTPIQKEAEGLYEQIHGKTQISHAMGELTGQMRTIVASEYGRWMKTGDPDRTIDLLQLSGQKRKVILFSLNSDDEAFFAKYVGSMIMADLTSVSAKRRVAGMKNKVNVYVDEFQAVNPDAVKGLLEKARESRMALTLAQQSFEQIITAAGSNGEAYLNAILGTCSNFIAHAGSTESTAERLSGIIGKDWFPAYKRSNENKRFIFSLNWFNRRNQTTITDEVERWIYEPRRFMQLSMPDKNNSFRSTAVVLNKSVSDPRYDNKDGATARTVWMIPDDRVIGSYYEPKMAEKDVEYLELVRENKILEQDEHLDQDYQPVADYDDGMPYQYEEQPMYDEYELAEQSAPQNDFARAVASTPVLADDEPEYEHAPLVDDDDGSFGWETIDEDDDIPTAESLGVSLNPEPNVVHEPGQSRQAPTQGLPSLDDRPSPRKQPQQPRQQGAVGNNGNGVRSSGLPTNGLPTRGVPTTKPGGGLPAGIPPNNATPQAPRARAPQQQPARRAVQPPQQQSQRQGAPQPTQSEQPLGFGDYWNNDIKPETLQQKKPKQAPPQQRQKPVRSKPVRSKPSSAQQQNTGGSKTSDGLPDIDLPDL